MAVGLRERESRGSGGLIGRDALEPLLDTFIASLAQVSEQAFP